MLHFLTRRILLTVPVLLGVATLVFSLIHLVPGDPVQAMLGEGAAPADIVELRARLGLDRPLIVQYGAFLKGLVNGDLGTSLRTNQPVAAAIAERMPATFELALVAMVMATLVAIPLGIIAAVRAGTPVDHAATTLALIGISIPNFWLGPLLAIGFSVGLGWFPVSGRGTPAHLVLPAITLAAPLAAILARMTRASVLEELHELYVLAARARGVSRFGAVMKHAFRNSLIPIVTVLGLQFGAVLTVSAVVGTLLGAIAGYFGGLVDDVISRVTDTLLAFPGLLLAIALVAALGPSLGHVLFALTIIGWVGYARLVRGQVLRAREFEYVQAARALGARTSRVLLRHVVPTAFPAIAVQATLGMAGAIIGEAGLSFLGLGIQPPAPSWGTMLNGGRAHLLDAPHLTLFPGLAIALLVLEFNFVGDGLRDLTDPKRRR